LLANKVCVVSESGLDPAELEYSEAVVFSKYENLTQTCIALIASPSKRNELAVNGNNYIKALNQEYYLEKTLPYI